jgi:hypothetical protein
MTAPNHTCLWQMCPGCGCALADDLAFWSGLAQQWQLTLAHLGGVGYASWMGQRKRSWLTKRDKVELFEQMIRREYEFDVGTIAGVSRKLGVHRRMVPMVREGVAQC